MSLDIKDGNANSKKLFTTVTGSSNDEHMAHHIVQEISGSNIASVIDILNNISASVKTGGSVQTITASYANPIPITGSINVDVQVSDLITVTSSLANPVVVGLYGSNNIRAFIDSNGAQLVTSSNSAPVYVSASLANPIGITGSTTINNLTQTAHNSSTYSGLLAPIGLVGSTGNRAFVDSNGAQLVTSSNSAPVYISASLTNPVGTTGSVTINNTSFVSYATTTHTSNVNPIALVGPSSYRADVDSSGSQKVGLFSATGVRAIIDSNGAQLITSSNAAPVYVSASLTNPIGITGSATINNLTQTAHNSSTYSGLLTPIGVVGSTGNRAFIDSNGAQLVTSSNSAPVYISASLSTPVGISGSTTVNNLAFTAYNASTYTSNVNAVTLVGSSSNRVDVDSYGSQKVGIFGATNNRTIVDSNGSLQITGSTTINNLTQTSHNSSTYSGLLTPIGIVGSSGNRVTVDSNNALLTTGSVTVNNLKDTDYNSTSYTAGKLTPIGLVGSSGYRANVDSNGAVQITGSALITGSVTVNNLKDTDHNSTSYSGKVTPSGLVGYSGYRLQIDSNGSLITTSSYANPVVVTASFSQPLATKITSSNSDFPYVRHTVPTGAIRNVFSTSDSTINFNDLTNLGAFQIAANNINRKGLTITNPTSQRLFIAIATQASSSDAGRNGFDLPNNNSDPSSYSFIIYPSGSYFADSTNVTLFYGGFFISSSNALKAMVTETY